MLVTYYSFAFINWISPRPLLMITGSEADRGTGGPADTGHYTSEAIERAKGPKELFVIEGRGHLDLYDKTAESVPKLAGFFVKSLCMHVGSAYLRYIKEPFNMISFSRLLKLAFF